MNTRHSLIVLIPIVAIAAIAGYFVLAGGHHAGDAAGSLAPALSDHAAGSGEPVASVAALTADPVALKSATKVCTEGFRQETSALCDNVRRAHSVLMADQYRRAARGTIASH